MYIYIYTRIFLPLTQIKLNRTNWTSVRTNNKSYLAFIEENKTKK